MRGFYEDINLNLKSKNLIVKTSLAFSGLILIILIILGQVEKFKIFSDIYSIIICFCISIMSFAKLNKGRDRYYKNLGYGFIYIGAIMIINTIVGKNFRNDISNCFIWAAIHYFQMIVLYISKVFKDKKDDDIMINLIFVFLFLVIVNIYFIIHNRVLFLTTEAKYFNLIFFIGISFAFYKIMKYSSKKEDKRIGDFIIISTLGLAINYIGHMNFWLSLNVLGNVFKFIAYIFLYIYYEENVLNIYYEYTKNIILDKEKELRKINKELVNQNKYLNESKKLFEKSDESYVSILNSINKGIFLFIDDELHSMNIKAKEFLKIRNYKEVDSQIEYILWNLTDEFFTEDEMDFGFMKEFNIKSNGVPMEIRVYLLRIDKRSKFILISNTTEYLEYRHLNDYLQTYLNAEKTSEDLYSNISHEIRTPINVISSALQLNEIYLNTNNFNGVKKYNTVIRKNCLRLIRTINNFIDADKLEGGFFDLNKKRYNVISIIDEVMDASIKYFKSTNTKVVFDPEEEEMYLYIDKCQLQRVLLNIFSNTLKYGKKENGLVEVKTIKTKKYIEISIHNDAPAIPEDKRRYIFDKFTKVDSSLARPSEGSGLGLFLTKELVEANNGSIELNSDEKGNTFRMLFPISYYDIENREESLEKESLMDLEEKVDIEFADVYF